MLTIVLKIIFWTSIGLILYSYFGYFVLVWLMSKCRRNKTKTESDHHPAISIIISAYNEEAVIGMKIENNIRLAYPKDLIEVLIGLDGSTDQTEAILRKNQNGLTRVFSYPRRRGKPAVLNDLVRQASGDILVFSDANTMYKTDAILKLTRHFYDPEVGGVCGKLILQESPGVDIGGKGERMYWNFESKLKHLEGSLNSVLGANGAIYAIRKELYEPLPETDLIVDDFLIPLKVVKQGYRVLYEYEAVATEFTGQSIWEEFRRKIRIGTANFNAIGEIRTLLSPKHGYVALGLWSHKIIRWFIPLLAMIVFVVNMALLGNPLYGVIFTAQSVFYASVIFGALLNHFGLHRNIFSLSFYFFMINLSLLVGFCRFLFKSGSPTWDPVKR